MLIFLNDMRAKKKQFISDMMTYFVVKLVLVRLILNHKKEGFPSS